MSNSIFNIILICAVLYTVYFILYGYFSYRKVGRNAKRVSKVFLIQGILLIGIYIGLMGFSFLSPETLGLQSIFNKVTSSNDAQEPINGLTGSLGNGLNGSYDYPSDTEVSGMLSRGDGFLKQNNIEAAINEFKKGLSKEEYKDIFDKRLEEALNVKEDYKIYQKGLAYFNKGDYENAYGEFKDIKPSEITFYSDVIAKMEIISSSGMANNANNKGGSTAAVEEQNTATPSDTQGNGETAPRP